MSYANEEDVRKSHILFIFLENYTSVSDHPPGGQRNTLYPGTKKSEINPETLSFHDFRRETVDQKNKKTCPKGKSNKKEYSAHRLMVEISGIEPLTS